MRRLLLFAAVAVLLLSVAPSVDAKKPKSKRRKKRSKAAATSPPHQEVSINAYEYCQACLHILETYHGLVEKEAGRMQRARMTQPVDGFKIAKDMCVSSFGEYPEWMKFSCIKMVNDGVDQVFTPLSGSHFIGERSAVYSHKRQACVDVGACKADSRYLVDTLKEKTACGACHAVVEDVEAEVALFDKPTRAQVAGVVEVVCERLGMRHANPAFIEEYCADIIDDAQGTSLTDDRGSLVGTIMLRQRLINSGMAPSDKLADRVCSDYTSYCPPLKDEL